MFFFHQKSTAYAKCIVANSENLKKDNCVKEFKEFQNCVKNVRILVFKGEIDANS